MVVQVVPRIACQESNRGDQCHSDGMLETPDRVDQGARLEQRRSIEIEMQKEKRGEEAQELRVRGRHAVAGTQMACGPRLLKESLERPVKALACELANERIDEG